MRPLPASRAMNGVSAAMNAARTKISSPDSVAVKPSTPCTYCGKMTVAPKSTEPIAKPSALPAAIARYLNARRSTSGRFAPHSSQQMNPAIPETVVTPNSTITGSENQSLRWPSSRMYCSEPSPVASKAKPSASMGIGFGSDGLRIIVSTTTAAKIPGTRLMKNTQFHEKLSVSQPPTVGPTDGPTIAPSANTACDAPSRWRGNVSRSAACDVATSPPPNSPWMTRYRMSCWIELAEPHSIEAIVNPMIATE